MHAPHIRNSLLFATSLSLAACQTGPNHPDPAMDGTLPLLGVHRIELAEGVTESEFEAFVNGPLAELWSEPIGGIQVFVTKADRGVEEGSYTATWAFESKAVRDSYFPNPTSVTPLFQEKVGSKITDVQAAFNKMAPSAGFTDYVVLFETEPSKDVDGPSLYGVHSFKLRPQVSTKEFEEFVMSTYAEAWRKPIAGMGHAIIKGERGEQTGEYKLLIRFSPASLRDRYVPDPRTLSAEFVEKVQPQLPVDVRLRFESMIQKQGFTDWGPIPTTKAK